MEKLDPMKDKKELPSFFDLIENKENFIRFLLDSDKKEVLSNSIDNAFLEILNTTDTNNIEFETKLSGLIDSLLLVPISKEFKIFWRSVFLQVTKLLPEFNSHQYKRFGFLIKKATNNEWRFILLAGDLQKIGLSANSSIKALHKDLAESLNFTEPKRIEERENYLIIKENCLKLSSLLDLTKNLVIMVNSLKYNEKEFHETLMTSNMLILKYINSVLALPTTNNCEEVCLLQTNAILLILGNGDMIKKDNEFQTLIIHSINVYFLRLKIYNKSKLVEFTKVLKQIYNFDKTTPLLYFISNKVPAIILDILFDLEKSLIEGQVIQLVFKIIQKKSTNLADNDLLNICNSVSKLMSLTSSRITLESKTVLLKMLIEFVELILGEKSVSEISRVLIIIFINIITNCLQEIKYYKKKLMDENNFVLVDTNLTRSEIIKLQEYLFLCLHGLRIYLYYNFHISTKNVEKKNTDDFSARIVNNSKESLINILKAFPILKLESTINIGQIYRLLGTSMYLIPGPIFSKIMPYLTDHIIFKVLTFKDFTFKPVMSMLYASSTLLLCFSFNFIRYFIKNFEKVVENEYSYKGSIEIITSLFLAFHRYKEQTEVLVPLYKKLLKVGCDYCFNNRDKSYRLNFVLSSITNINKVALVIFKKENDARETMNLQQMCYLTNKLECLLYSDSKHIKSKALSALLTVVNDNMTVRRIVIKYIHICTIFISSKNKETKKVIFSILEYLFISHGYSYMFRILNDIRDKSKKKFLQGIYANFDILKESYTKYSVLYFNMNKYIKENNIDLYETGKYFHIKKQDYPELNISLTFNKIPLNLETLLNNYYTDCKLNKISTTVIEQYFSLLYKIQKEGKQKYKAITKFIKINLYFQLTEELFVIIKKYANQGNPSLKFYINLIINVSKLFCKKNLIILPKLKRVYGYLMSTGFLEIFTDKIMDQIYNDYVNINRSNKNKYQFISLLILESVRTKNTKEDSKRLFNLYMEFNFYELLLSVDSEQEFIKTLGIGSIVIDNEDKLKYAISSLFSKNKICYRVWALTLIHNKQSNPVFNMKANRKIMEKTIIGEIRQYADIKTFFIYKYLYFMKVINLLLQGDLFDFNTVLETELFVGFCGKIRMVFTKEILQEQINIYETAILLDNTEITEYGEINEILKKSRKETFIFLDHMREHYPKFKRKAFLEKQEAVFLVSAYQNNNSSYIRESTGLQNQKKSIPEIIKNLNKINEDYKFSVLFLKAISSSLNEYHSRAMFDNILGAIDAAVNNFNVQTKNKHSLLLNSRLVKFVLEVISVFLSSESQIKNYFKEILITCLNMNFMRLDNYSFFGYGYGHFSPFLEIAHKIIEMNPEEALKFFFSKERFYKTGFNNIFINHIQDDRHHKIRFELTNNHHFIEECFKFKEEKGRALETESKKFYLKSSALNIMKGLVKDQKFLNLHAIFNLIVNEYLAAFKKKDEIVNQAAYLKALRTNLCSEELRTRSILAHLFCKFLYSSHFTLNLLFLVLESLNDETVKHRIKLGKFLHLKVVQLMKNSSADERIKFIQQLINNSKIVISVKNKRLHNLFFLKIVKKAILDHYKLTFEELKAGKIKNVKKINEVTYFLQELIYDILGVKNDKISKILTDTAALNSENMREATNYMKLVNHLSIQFHKNGVQLHSFDVEIPLGLDFKKYASISSSNFYSELIYLTLVTNFGFDTKISKASHTIKEMYALFVILLKIDITVDTENNLYREAFAKLFLKLMESSDDNYKNKIKNDIFNTSIYNTNCENCIIRLCRFLIIFSKLCPDFIVFHYRIAIKSLSKFVNPFYLINISRGMFINTVDSFLNNLKESFKSDEIDAEGKKEIGLCIGKLVGMLIRFVIANEGFASKLRIERANRMVFDNINSGFMANNTEIMELCRIFNVAISSTNNVPRKQEGSFHNTKKRLMDFAIIYLKGKLIPAKSKIIFLSNIENILEKETAKILNLVYRPYFENFTQLLSILFSDQALYSEITINLITHLLNIISVELSNIEKEFDFLKLNKILSLVKIFTQKGNLGALGKDDNSKINFFNGVYFNLLNLLYKAALLAIERLELESGTDSINSKTSNLNKTFLEVMKLTNIILTQTITVSKIKKDSPNNTNRDNEIHMLNINPLNHTNTQLTNLTSQNYTYIDYVPSTVTKFVSLLSFKLKVLDPLFFVQVIAFLTKGNMGIFIKEIPNVFKECILERLIDLDIEPLANIYRFVDFSEENVKSKPIYLPYSEKKQRSTRGKIRGLEKKADRLKEIVENSIILFNDVCIEVILAEDWDKECTVSFYILLWLVSTFEFYNVVSVDITKKLEQYQKVFRKFDYYFDTFIESLNEKKLYLYKNFKLFIQNQLLFFSQNTRYLAIARNQLPKENIASYIHANFVEKINELPKFLFFLKKRNSENGYILTYILIEIFKKNKDAEIFVRLVRSCPWLVSYIAAETKNYKEHKKIIRICLYYLEKLYQTEPELFNTLFQETFKILWKYKQTAFINSLFLTYNVGHDFDLLTRCAINSIRYVPDHVVFIYFLMALEEKNNVSTNDNAFTFQLNVAQEGWLHCAKEMGVWKEIEEMAAFNGNADLFLLSLWKQENWYHHINKLVSIDGDQLEGEIIPIKAFCLLANFADVLNDKASVYITPGCLEQNKRNNVNKENEKGPLINMETKKAVENRLRLIFIEFEKYINAIIETSYDTIQVPKNSSQSFLLIIVVKKLGELFFSVSLCLEEIWGWEISGNIKEYNYKKFEENIVKIKDLIVSIDNIKSPSYSQVSYLEDIYLMVSRAYTMISKVLFSHFQVLEAYKNNYYIIKCRNYIKSYSKFTTLMEVFKVAKNLRNNIGKKVKKKIDPISLSDEGMCGFYLKGEVEKHLDFSKVCRKKFSADRSKNIIVNISNEILFETSDLTKVQIELVKILKEDENSRKDSITQLNSIESVSSTPYVNSEVSRVKAKISAPFSPPGLINGLYSNSIMFFNGNLKTWYEWGNFCDGQFKLTSKIHWSNHAISCYMHSLLDADSKRILIIPRIIALLNKSSAEFNFTANTNTQSFDRPANIVTNIDEVDRNVVKEGLTEQEFKKSFFRTANQVPPIVWMNYLLDLFLNISNNDAEIYTFLIKKLSLNYTSLVSFYLRAFRDYYKTREDSEKTLGILSDIETFIKAKDQETFELNESFSCYVENFIVYTEISFLHKLYKLKLKAISDYKINNKDEGRAQKLKDDIKKLVALFIKKQPKGIQTQMLIIRKQFFSKMKKVFEQESNNSNFKELIKSINDVIIKNKNMEFKFLKLPYTKLTYVPLSSYNRSCDINFSVPIKIKRVSDRVLAFSNTFDASVRSGPRYTIRMSDRNGNTHYLEVHGLYATAKDSPGDFVSKLKVNQIKTFLNYAGESFQSQNVKKCTLERRVFVPISCDVLLEKVVNFKYKEIVVGTIDVSLETEFEKELLCIDNEDGEKVNEGYEVRMKIPNKLIRGKLMREFVATSFFHVLFERTMCLGSQYSTSINLSTELFLSLDNIRLDNEAIGILDKLKGDNILKAVKRNFNTRAVYQELITCLRYFIVLFKKRRKPLVNFFEMVYSNLFHHDNGGDYGENEEAAKRMVENIFSNMDIKTYENQISDLEYGREQEGENVVGGGNNLSVVYFEDIIKKMLD